MVAHLRLVPAIAGLAALASCDLSGDFLFPQVEGIPFAYEITGPDGGPLVPVRINSEDDVRANTIYGEIAPSNDSLLGGVTFTFLGTGGDVCIWVDPEAAAWNTAISQQPSSGSDETAGERWLYPDNPFDDGDLDLTAGLSVYYTGSPGVLGDFEVAYEDSLGNDIAISLAGCPNEFGDNSELVSSGKGQPEFCTLSTIGAEGISHTVVLRSFSIPVDDSRLGYGLLLAQGTCDGLFSRSGVGGAGGNPGDADIDPVLAECLITGEMLEPLPVDGEPEDYVPYVGYDSIVDRIWPRALEFEDRYCRDSSVRGYCRDEAREVSNAGLRCAWEQFDPADYDVDERCFCGDPQDMPDASAF